jgi:hypothetical protein
MKKQTLQQRIAAIKARNKAFEKLSPAKKRVAIAKDVLAQLKTKKFIAQSGTYVDTDVILTKADLKRDASLVLDKAPSCTVCGIGGLFVSAVCQADKAPVSQFGYNSGDEGADFQVDGQSAYNYLEQFFDSQTLVNIESAFEQESFSRWTDTETFHGSTDAKRFAYNESDDNTRLRLIMENIVKNRGEFIPYF